MKERPNHGRCTQVLRSMMPEQRLAKAFELSDFSRRLFVHGLRKRHPDLEEDEFAKLLRSRLDKRHDRSC